MKVVSSIKVKDYIQSDIKTKFPEVEFCFNQKMSDAEKDLVDAEVLITYGNDLTKERIDAAKNLRWVAVFSAGLEDLPFKSLQDRGIQVTNARGIHKIPMAEYTFSMILQVYKNARQLYKNEERGVWDQKVKMVELHGRTLTILGVGAIGGEIARIGKAFGMEVLGVNRSGHHVEYVDKIYTIEKLDNAIEQADVIVSVLPSTNETKGLLKPNHFKKMKDHTLFMNIGRGDLVDEKVLMDALENNEIGCAVLDVFENEPLESHHPFWGMDNAIVTPHLSSISKAYQNRCFELFERNLKQFLYDGTISINKIDLSRGY